jgi:hypothetical protein
MIVSPEHALPRGNEKLFHRLEVVAWRARAAAAPLSGSPCCSRLESLTARGGSTPTFGDDGEKLHSRVWMHATWRLWASLQR